MHEWSNWPKRGKQDPERGEGRPREEIPLEERQGHEYAMRRASELTAGTGLTEQRRRGVENPRPETGAREQEPAEDWRLSATAHQR